MTDDLGGATSFVIFVAVGAFAFGGAFTFGFAAAVAPAGASALSTGAAFFATGAAAESVFFLTVLRFGFAASAAAVRPR